MPIVGDDFLEFFDRTLADRITGQQALWKFSSLVKLRKRCSVAEDAAVAQKYAAKAETRDQKSERADELSAE